ncbi:hypothetical protein GGS26DRAFT_39088 [Hypomontagnella submonticulosa]|nr:hypothetical protein GGS26DRAFT_39088 [Hypomontagnella submonticulosa]
MLLTWPIVPRAHIVCIKVKANTFGDSRRKDKQSLAWYHSALTPSMSIVKPIEVHSYDCFFFLVACNIEHVNHPEAGIMLQIIRLAPSTASPSAATFPAVPAWPLTHWKYVFVPAASRSSILARMASTRSLFFTGPSLVLQPFFCQFTYHSVAQLIEYLLSEKIRIFWLVGTLSKARRTAVNSALWFVCMSPLRRSETFLYRGVSK